MATKAELETELETLKQEMAARKAAAGTGEATTDDETAGNDETTVGRQALFDMLKSHGIDPDDLDVDRLWQQLSDEMGDVMRKRPAMTAIAIFTFGFLLGRASK